MTIETVYHGLGEQMGHDIQIKVESKNHYAEREWNGKTYPERKETYLLADIRLGSHDYVFGDDCDLIERARKVFDALREAYQDYPDGDVEVTMIFCDSYINC
jgi:hypothetical protein